MAQRELVVKVSAEIDANLTKLLDTLRNKKVHKIPVSVELADKAFKDFEGKLKGYTKGNHSIKLEPKVDGRALNSLTKKLEESDNRVDQLNTKEVNIKVNTEGLQELGNTLDSLSSKVVSTASRALVAGGKDIIANTRGLYDAQQSFVTQMEALGRSDSHIKKNLTDITEFGRKTKFSIEELTTLMGDFDAQGWDGAVDITKHMATIASMGPDSAQAIKTLSRELRQASKAGALMNGDWNRIRQQIGGYSASKLEEYFKNEKNLYGEETLKDAFANKHITGEEFVKAVQHVASNDKLLQKYVTQSNTLGSALDNLKESFYSTFVGTPYSKGELSKVYDGTVKFINDLQENIPDVARAINDLIGVGRDMFKDIFGEFDIKENLEGFKSAITPLVGTLRVLAKVLGFVSANGRNTGALIGSIITASSGYLMVRKLHKSLKALSAIGGITIPAFGTKSSGGSAKDMATNMASAKVQMMGMLKNAGTLLSIAVSFKVMASGFKDIASVDVPVEKVLANMISMSILITGASTAMWGMGKLLEKFPGIGQKMGTGAFTLMAITASLWTISKMMQSISNINFDGDKVSNMLVDMGKVIAGFTGISAIVGGLSLASGGTVGTALVTGALIINAMALGLVGLAYQSVALAKAGEMFMAIKLPSESELNSQVGKLVGYIKAVSGLSAISVVASVVNIPAGIFGTLGNLMSTSNISSLELSINSMSRLSKAVSKAPSTSDISASVGKIVGIYKEFDRLQQEIDNANGWDIVNLFDGVSNFFSGIGDKLSIDGISSGVMQMMSFIKEVDSFTVPDLEGTKAKIKDLHSFIGELTAITTTTTEDGGRTVTTSNRGSLFGAWSSGFKASEISNVIKSMKQVVDLIGSMGSIDFSKIEDVKSNITRLQEMLVSVQKTFSESSWWDSFVTSMSNSFNSGSTSKVIDTMTNLVKLVKSLSKLTIPSEQEINTKLEGLKNVLEKLRDWKVPSLGKMDENTTKGLEKIVDLIKKVNEITEKLKNVGAEDLTPYIANVTNALTQLQTIPTHPIFADKNISSKDFGESIGRIVTFVTNMASVATALQTMASTGLTPEQILPPITAITKALSAFTTTNESGLSLVGMIEAFKGKDLKTIVAFVTSVGDIATSLHAIPPLDEALITDNISTIDKALQQIAKFDQYSESLEGASGILSKITELKTAIVEFANSLKATGVLAGSTFADGFKSDAGVGSKLYDKVKEQKKKAEELDWADTGRAAGRKLTDAFDVSGILTKVQSIQNAINGLQGKSIDIAINRTTYTRTVKRQHGGIIPEYHSTGGVIGRGWRQSGTDTVPAMLTAGEYVLKRSVTSFLGKSFLDSLNQMNLTSALNSLAGKMGNSVVNNTYNSITQNVDNKASFVNGLGAIRRVIRP